MRITNSMSGFSLTEVLVATAILGIFVTAISAVYSSGLQTLDVQADHMLLDSRLRGRMEHLVGTPFAQIISGSENVTVRGTNYTINWSVSLKDLDGDSTPEFTAKELTVSVAELPNRSLTTILVDNEDKVGKI